MRRALFFCCSVIVGVLWSNGVAFANESRANAMACLLTNGWTYGSVGYKQTGSSTLVCPFTDDNQMFETYSYVLRPPLRPLILRGRSINYLNVHGSNPAGGTVVVSACIKSSLGSSYTCGTAATVTASGVFTASPGLAAWQQNGYDFAYLSINASSNAVIYGWWAAY